ncbi:MAG: GNAT family N-acetyltransferase [Actinomycetota bacterium]|nr:GNAT family N-acetyltransferase [Actinomycetota bacterium]
MHEDVRPAVGADVPAILELAGALRAELSPMRGGSIWAVREARPEPLEAAYKALVDRTDARVVVGTIDGTPVGFGVGEVEILQDGSRLGVVSELFVDPEARAVGVGEAMLGSLVDHFASIGCIGVDAFALPGHRAAKNFFEESGFTARGILMHHRLAPGGTGDSGGNPEIQP